MIMNILSVCIVDALQNLYENRKNAIVFMIFLVMNFTGIIVTDSLIYSVSQRAETELTISGDKIISVDFRTPVSITKINSIFSGANYDISVSKKNYFIMGNSPYSDNVEVVVGVDQKRISLWGISSALPFQGDVAIVNDKSQDGRDNLFIAGIPFDVVGYKKDRPTVFLDSLGLGGHDSYGSVFIPIDTMFRLSLDNNIDNVNFIKCKEVNIEDVMWIEKKLNKNGIDNFSVTSYLDAKRAVNNVLSRFNILTNSIYILLTVMSLVIVYTISRRNYQLRGTEFALKIIHGVDKKLIILIVIIETFITNLLGCLISIFFSLILLKILSSIFNTDIFFRFNMICISLLVVMLVSYISGLYSGRVFFKKDPILLIRRRMQ